MAIETRYLLWYLHFPKTNCFAVLSHFHITSSRCKKDCKEKWCYQATCIHCFGQTIIPIKLIRVSFLSHNVLAKSFPPLNKTQCLLIRGLNLSPRPKWDWIILSNLPSCIVRYPWFPLHFYVFFYSLWGQSCCPSVAQTVIKTCISAHSHLDYPVFSAIHLPVNSNQLPSP